MTPRVGYRRPGAGGGGGGGGGGAGRCARRGWQRRDVELPLQRGEIGQVDRADDVDDGELCRLGDENGKAAGSVAFAPAVESPHEGSLWDENALMTAFVLPLLIGAVAGLRTMTAPAAVSWASRIGWLDVATTPLAFFGYPVTPWVFTALGLGELVVDQLPTTPSRTETLPFGARIIAGALCGGAIGASGGALLTGLLAGIAGATIGTLGGHTLRARLAEAFGRDRRAALIEDAVAIVSAFLVMVALP